MDPQYQTIDYTIGTSLPEDLPGLRIFTLDQFTIQNFQQQIITKTSLSISVQAIQLLIYRFYDSFTQKQYSTLLNLIPKLRFLRIFILGSQYCCSQELPKLIKGVGSPSIIQIYLKKLTIFKHLKESIHQNVRYVLVKSFMTPIIVKQKTVIPQNTIRELTKVDDSLWSYLDSKGLEHCPNISSWLCLQLKCKKITEQMRLLKTIQQINFIELRAFDCSGCCINSIEPLSFISAPVLERIFIENNSITSLHSFIKLASSNIRKCLIGNNEFSQCYRLSEANWPFLWDLQIDTRVNHGQIVQSRAFASKFTYITDKIRLQIMCSSVKRIDEEMIKKRLSENKQKFFNWR